MRSSRVPEGGHERGSAIVEFLGVTVLLLVPCLYLVVAVADIQRSAFAAEALAYDAARSAVAAGLRAQDGGGSDAAAWGSAQERVAATVPVVLDGFGVSPDVTQVHVSCVGECLSPGTLVGASVMIEVPLPGLEWTPLSVGVSASAVAPVDRWGE